MSRYKPFVFQNIQIVHYITIMTLLLLFLLVVYLFRRLLISECTKIDGTKGDGKTQGTCKDPKQKCVANGKCLGS